jgi:hypothetical protein
VSSEQYAASSQQSRLRSSKQYAVGSKQARLGRRPIRVLQLPQQPKALLVATAGGGVDGGAAHAVRLPHAHPAVEQRLQP